MSPGKPKGDEPEEADEKAVGPTEEEPKQPVSAPESPAEKKPDWENSYKYLMADFENFRRRVEREREKAVNSATGKLLLRIIDLHDGVERAAASLPADATVIREGLNLLTRNLEALLKDEKIERLARVGETFAIDVHEAVGKVPPTADAPEGTVAVIVQQGYRGPGGILRPARVLVADESAAQGKGPVKEDESATT
jgi:molecular chaperone GrpE